MEGPSLRGVCVWGGGSEGCSHPIRGRGWRGRYRKVCVGGGRAVVTPQSCGPHLGPNLPRSPTCHLIPPSPPRCMILPVQAAPSVSALISGPTWPASLWRAPRSA